MDMEDSKSSSEESDQSEQSNDDTSTGRSYKCVFCKRGFTTAQALGGHMNIHRKDRPKPRPNNSSVPSNSSKAYEDYASFGAFPPIQIFPSHHYPLPHEVHINYQAYFPAPTWEVRSQHAQHIDNSYVQIAHHLNPFTEGWPRSLSLQIGPPHSQIIENGEDDRKDELDLELRLGHHQ